MSRPKIPILDQRLFQLSAVIAFMLFCFFVLFCFVLFKNCSHASFCFCCRSSSSSCRCRDWYLLAVRSLTWTVFALFSLLNACFFATPCLVPAMGKDVEQVVRGGIWQLTLGRKKGLPLPPTQNAENRRPCGLGSNLLQCRVIQVLASLDGQSIGEPIGLKPCLSPHT